MRYQQIGFYTIQIFRISSIKRLILGIIKFSFLLGRRVLILILILYDCPLFVY